MIAYKNWLVFRRLWLPLLIVGVLVCFAVIASKIDWVKVGADLLFVGVILLFVGPPVWILFGTHILAWIKRRHAYRELFQAYKKMQKESYEEAFRIYPSQHLSIHGEDEEEWRRMVDKQTDYALAKEKAWFKQFKKQFKEPGSVARYRFQWQIFREAVKEIAKGESQEMKKEIKRVLKEQAGINSKEEKEKMEALQRFADQKGITYLEAVREKATELVMQGAKEWGTPEEAWQWSSLVSKLKRDYSRYSDKATKDIREGNTET